MDFLIPDFPQLIWGTSPETHKLLFDKLFQVKKKTMYVAPSFNSMQNRDTYKI